MNTLTIENEIEEESVFTLDIRDEIQVGSFLKLDNVKHFQVVGYKTEQIGKHKISLPLFKCIKKVKKGSYEISFSKNGYSLAIITLSDKGYANEREDESGQVIKDILEKSLELSYCSQYLLPDNPQKLQALVSSLAYEESFDIIVTTGGTGIAPTDLTPEAIIPLLTRRFHGFEQAMMTASFAKTPNALISRAFVGTMHKCFIIALQGSPKAVKENLEAIIASLPHTLEKLHGSKEDCARQ